MTLEFDGQPIQRLQLSLPRHGAWQCDVRFSGPFAPAAGTFSRLSIHGSSYMGTIIDRNVVSPGRVECRIVGGRGGMSTVPVRAIHHSEAPVSTVVSSILNGTGETTLTLPVAMRSARVRWEITSNVPAGKQLSSLVAKFGRFAWRLDPETGSVLITDDQDADEVEVPTQSTLINTTANGIRTYTIHDPKATMPLPGQTLDGVVIGEVIIDADQRSCTVTLSETSLAELLDGVAARTHRTTFVESYPCTVEGQNDDGTLKLNPDDPRIKGGGLNNVAIRSIVGATLTVPTGERCFIQFDAGDASRPFVSGFQQHTSFNGFVVTLGDTESAQFVGLANLINDHFNALKTWMDAHVHPTGTGPSGPPSSVSPTPVDVSCERLKTN